MSLLPARALRANMARREAVYVVGAADTGTDRLDLSKPAMLQGHDRVERARNYSAYIRRTPDWAKSVEFRVIPGAAHLSLVASESPELASLLFGPPASAGPVAAKR